MNKHILSSKSSEQTNANSEAFFAGNMEASQLEFSTKKETLQDLLPPNNWSHDPIIVESVLSSEDQKKLACAINITHGKNISLNDLEVSFSPFQLSMLLEYQWNIKSEEDAIHTLDWLINEGHRKLFDKLWVLIKDIDVDEMEAHVNGISAKLLVESNSYNLYGKAINLVNGYKHLMYSGCFRNNTQLNILSWDLVRAIYLCRLVYSSQYLSKDACLEYINKCAKQLFNTYGSWLELSEGYMLGLAMFTGDDYQVEEMLMQHELLLSHRLSPWVSMEW